jgi:dihydrofolate reductase
MTVTLFVATSLDGYIAGPDDDLSWRFTDEDYGFSDFYDSVDTLIMGRGTYEVVKSFPKWPYSDKASVVVSRSGDVTADTPGVTVFGGNLPDLLKDLADDGAEEVWLVGGAELIRSFLREKLIDRITVSLHPVLLGRGVKLFHDGFPHTALELEAAVSYDSGLVQLNYHVPREE